MGTKPFLVRPPISEPSNADERRDIDPMPNDPEALMEWANRNIQDEPANDFERKRAHGQPPLCKPSRTDERREICCQALALAQRARRILEELRKRFGEGFRPQLELDYIERLLKDF